jgi:hypothetical protein
MAIKKVDLTDEEFHKLLGEKKKDPVFQYWVGYCYYNEIGVERNHTDAIKWYKLSAEQGYAPAQNDLGIIFEFGQGVEKDSKKAVELYTLAADQGHHLAQYNLGYYYRIATFVEQDYNKALELYCKSSGQGYWYATREVGDMYFDGEGVKQDLSKAKEYYEKALAQADKESIYWYKADIIDKKQIQDKLDEVNVEIEKAEEKKIALQRAARSDVFVCYSHKDMKYKEEFDRYLEALEIDCGIKYWTDEKLGPNDWDSDIKSALSRAKIAVLMVSVDFQISKYIRDVELPKILAAAEEEGASIAPILIGSCKFEKILNKPNFKLGINNPINQIQCSGERDNEYKKFADYIEVLYNQKTDK